jgi:hypothetical protein
MIHTGVLVSRKLEPDTQASVAKLPTMLVAGPRSQHVYGPVAKLLVTGLIGPGHRSPTLAKGENRTAARQTTSVLEFGGPFCL